MAALSCREGLREVYLTLLLPPEGGGWEGGSFYFCFCFDGKAIVYVANSLCFRAVFPLPNPPPPGEGTWTVHQPDVSVDFPLCAVRYCLVLYINAVVAT